jgi:hypothetical protein
MLFDDNENVFTLNNALNKTTFFYKIMSNVVNINKQTKIIGSIYNNNNTLVLKINYIILGSYDTHKNIWIWGSNTTVLNKEFITENKQIRNYLHDIVHNKEFIKTNISVITYSSFVELLQLLSLILYNWKQYILITLKKTHNITHVYLVKNILYESIL